MQIKVNGFFGKLWLDVTYGRTVTFQNEDGDDGDSLDSYEPKPPDPFVIIRSKKMNPKVSLNIGGEFHDVMWATLEKIPKSRLGKLAFAQNHDEILVKKTLFSCKSL